MRVLYFGSRPACHASFAVPIPAKASVWFANNAATWLGTFASGPQYGQFPSAWQ